MTNRQVSGGFAGLLLLTLAACGTSGGSPAARPPEGSGGSPGTLDAGGMAGAGSGGVVGTDGAGGSAGMTGSGGADAGGGTIATDGGPADVTPPPADAAGGPASYTCSLILGIATTSEWFGDFEKLVDNARWELKFQDSAHIEKWADPANAVWALPITSRCAQNGDQPERVVFMGVNYDFATVDLFLPKYIAVLNNVKAKYPSVKRMDVMTYTRGPGDQQCIGANRSNDSYIKPAQDEAIAMFASMYQGFVFPAPKWETASCKDFTLCPHLTGQANAAVAKMIAAYFTAN